MIMNPRLHPRRARAGHTLWFVLVATGLVGLVLASYLKLTQSQSVFTVRSQIWNNCIPLVEAGVEEALAQLNAFADTNLAASGWTPISSGFEKSRALNEGGYVVQVTYTNILQPVITSTGYLPAPAALARANTWMLAAAFVPDPNVRYITRTVRVTCRKEALFTKAMVARDYIDFNGNNVYTDSYDSSNPLFSSPTGDYDPTKARDNGDVAVNKDFLNVGSLGNANIKGHVIVGPQATVNIGPNGIVGSLAWFAAGKKGIQPGRLRKDANFLLPDVSPPWTSGGLEPSGTSGQKYRLDSGNYELNTLSLAKGERMKVYGDATLYVKANVDVQGDIEIIPPGRLILYVGGPNVSFTGSLSKSGLPKDFVIYGLPSCKNFEVKTTSGTLNAVIYAPSADLLINSQNQVCGAIVARMIRMNGNSAFHFDESLANLGRHRGYTITSWNEL
jgi:hypothetical protein